MPASALLMLERGLQLACWIRCNTTVRPWTSCELVTVQSLSKLAFPVPSSSRSPTARRCRCGRWRVLSPWAHVAVCSHRRHPQRLGITTRHL